MTKCFLVQKVNVRTTVVPGKPFCCDPPVEGCTPTPDREESTFDIARVDTGEILVRDTWYMRGLPPGAMWFQTITERNRPSGPNDWPEEGYVKPSPDAARGPSYTFADGEHLTVMTPGGVWVIDSRASNCTMPYDYNHRCWVRHGEPPEITVDKAGTTCAAGAGSIQCGSYHGFLQNGSLT